MSDFDLGLSYRSDIGPNLFNDFISQISVPELRLAIDEREESFYAALEWFIPTVVFVFISKSYFDGFLKEMGKEHYHLLKNAIMTLAKRLLGPSVPKFAIISSGKGKVSKDNPFSPIYSVVAEIGGGKSIKLLIQNDFSEQQYDELLEVFMEFLHNFHNNQNTKSLKKLEINSRRTILVAYNPVTKAIEQVS